MCLRLMCFGLLRAYVLTHRNTLQQICMFVCVGVGGIGGVNDSQGKTCKTHQPRNYEAGTHTRFVII